jgi:hypothetical protein
LLAAPSPPTLEAPGTDEFEAEVAAPLPELAALAACWGVPVPTTEQPL